MRGKSGLCDLTLRPAAFSNTVSVEPYLDFGVAAPGILTSNGGTLETILGGCYCLWLTEEGLLTGHDAADGFPLQVAVSHPYLLSSPGRFRDKLHGPAT